jgi:hypothetical protein
MPTSRKLGSRTFTLCSGLSIQPSMIAAGVPIVPLPQPMFSPSDQSPAWLR